jgi:hypothetical protein
MSVIGLSSYLCRINSEDAGEMEKYRGALSAMVLYTSLIFGGCALGMDDAGFNRQVQHPRLRSDELWDAKADDA